MYRSVGVYFRYVWYVWYVQSGTHVVDIKCGGSTTWKCREDLLFVGRHLSRFLLDGFDLLHIVYWVGFGLSIWYDLI